MIKKFLVPLNHNESLIYLTMSQKKIPALEINNSWSCYDNIENYEKMKKYYLMAISECEVNADNSIEEFTTPLEKMNVKTTTDDCGMCIEKNSKECITLNCRSHHVCKECYIKLYDKPCPFCRL